MSSQTLARPKKSGTSNRKKKKTHAGWMAWWPLLAGIAITLGAVKTAEILPLMAASQAASAGPVRADKQQLVADNVVCAVDSLRPVHQHSNEMETALDSAYAGGGNTPAGLRRTVATGAELNAGNRLQ
jgi:hypothetical protein